MNAGLTTAIQMHVQFGRKTRMNGLRDHVGLRMRIEFHDVSTLLP